MNELTPDEHKILVDAIQDSATVVHKGRKDMNERIKELYEQSLIRETGKDHAGNPMLVIKQNPEKFAELIVRECVAICQDVDGEDNIDAKSGRQDCAVEIKEHFGVEL